MRCKICKGTGCIAADCISGDDCDIEDCPVCGGSGELIERWDKRKDEDDYINREILPGNR